MVGEEVRSVGRCGEFVVGILIGRRNSSQNTNAEVRTTTCTTEPTLANGPREIALFRRLTQEKALKSAPLGCGEPSGANPTVAGPLAFEEWLHHFQDPPVRPNKIKVLSL